MADEFIQKAIKQNGALSEDLGIPEEKNIPDRLLSKIISAKAGQTIVNPSGMGKKRIKVTRTLERRAIFAKTLKKFKKRKDNQHTCPNVGFDVTFPTNPF